MSKKRNYTNYYSKSTYQNQKKNNYHKPEEKKEEPKVEVKEEEVVETKPEISPEEKIEKTEQKPKKRTFPDRVDLIDNLYIRETPGGHNVPMDELDRLISSKVIKDFKGNAIVPKGTRLDVYDVVEMDDGAVYINTKFGYLMAESNDGDKYVKEVVY